MDPNPNSRNFTHPCKLKPMTNFRMRPIIESKWRNNRDKNMNKGLEEGKRLGKITRH